MKDYGNFIKILSAATGIQFQRASEDDISRLTCLGIPSEVLKYYVRYVPANTVEYRIRLWSVDELIEENTELLPGCCTSKYGYIVFASTLNGDAYCFDLNKCDSDNDPQIVLISHETIFEDTVRIEIAQCAIPVAQNLWEFLRMLTEDSASLKGS